MKPLLKLAAWVAGTVLSAAGAYWTYGTGTVAGAMLCILWCASVIACAVNATFSYQDAVEAFDDGEGEWW
jgi:1,4-dihydroxy-2-naphthoate octaprenyltransferase